MSTSDQAVQVAIKDEDSEHPNASAWRPTFCEGVAAFVRGDYGLGRGVEFVEAVSADSAQQIREYIEDYDETLIELPAETWENSVAQWMDPHWDVLLDLWTEGEGASDLVLGVCVHEVESGFRVTVEMVYVP